MLTNPNCEYEANYVAIHTLAQWSKNINTNFVKSSSKGLVTLTESERESENFISSLQHVKFPNRLSESDVAFDFD